MESAHRRPLGYGSCSCPIMANLVAEVWLTARLRKQTEVPHRELIALRNVLPQLSLNYSRETLLYQPSPKRLLIQAFRIHLRLLKNSATQPSFLIGDDR
jgi:hypothetical protein